MTANVAPSPADLQAAHDALLGRKEAARDDAFWAAAVAFVRDACRAGATLDDDEDRFAIQRLVTYWVNELCRARRPLPRQTTLAAFDDTEPLDLPDSARPYFNAEEFEGRLSELPGWRRLIAECLDHLRTTRLAVVVGPPGCGRRTLIRQRIVPAVRGGELPGSGSWRVVELQPTAKDSLENLVRALAPHADVATVAAAVRADPTRLASVLAGQTVLLVIDNFEAVFTFAQRDDIRPWTQAVLALRDAGHHVVLALRSDVLPKLRADPDLARAVEQSQVLVLFTTAELRQLIEEPAKRIKLRFDAGVVDRLIADVQGDPAVGPLLQFSLLQLWDRRVGNRITKDTYEELGGGRTALRQTAERVYDELQRLGFGDLPRRLFEALVQADLTGFRYPAVPLEQLHALGDPAQVHDVLDRLERARLVARDSQDRYALAYRALAEAWPQLVEWLALQRVDRRRSEALLAVAEKWRDSNYDRRLLWVGPALADAKTYRYLDHDLQHRFLRACDRKVRHARRWRLAFLVFLGVVALTLVAVYDLYQRQKLAAAERDNRKQDLQIALMTVDTGTTRLAAGDQPGAALWYERALTMLDQATHAPGRGDPAGERLDVLTSDQRDLWRDNLLLRTGLTHQRFPAVRLLLPGVDVGAAAFSTAASGHPDGRWAVTLADRRNEVHVWNLRDPDRPPVGVTHDAAAVLAGATFRTAGGQSFLLVPAAVAGRPVVRLWTRPADGGRDWTDGAVESAYRPDGPADIVQADLSPDGRFAAVVLQQPPPASPAFTIHFVPVRDGRLAAADAKAFPPPQEAVAVPQLAFRPGPDPIAAVALQVPDRPADSGAVWLVHAQTGEAVGLQDSSAAAPAPIQQIAFNAQGTGLLVCSGRDTGSPDGWKVALWDTRTVAREAVRPAGTYEPNEVILSAGFNAAGDRVVTCGVTGRAVLHAVDPTFARPGLTPTKTLPHGLSVYAAGFSPDGRHVVTGCRDKTARVWDVATGEPAFPPVWHTGTVSGVSFRDDGRAVLSVCGGANNKTRERDVTVAQVWALPDAEAEYLPLAGPPQWVGPAFQADTFLASLSENGESETRVWTLNPGRPPTASRPLLQAGRVSFAAHDPAAGRAATAAGKAVRVWDTQAGTLLSKLDHAATVNHALFGRNDLLVTAAGDAGQQNGAVTFWDAATGRRRFRTRPEDDPTLVEDVLSHLPRWARPPVLQAARKAAGDWPYLFAAGSPDGEHLVAVGGRPDPAADPAAETWGRLFPVRTPGESIALQGGHAERVTFAAFSPDGRYVVTTSVDDTACVWELPTDESRVIRPRRRLKRHTADVVRAVFSSDRHPWVLTVGQDGLAVLWDYQKGTELLTLGHGAGQGGRIAAVSFRPDDKYAVTAGDDGRVCVWQLQVGTEDERKSLPPPLVATLDHPGRVLAAEFAADGRRLRVLSQPGMPRPARLVMTEWTCEPAAGDPIRGMAARVVARREVADGRDLRTLPADELRAAWTQAEPALSARLRADDGPAAVRYHDRTARQAESEGQWDAARWHLERAVAGGPDAALYLRLAEVTDKAATDPDRKAKRVTDAYRRCVEAYERQERASLNLADPRVQVRLGDAYRRLLPPPDLPADGDRATWRRHCERAVEHYGRAVDYYRDAQAPRWAVEAVAARLDVFEVWARLDATKWDAVYADCTEVLAATDRPPPPDGGLRLLELRAEAYDQLPAPLWHAQAVDDHLRCANLLHAVLPPLAGNPAGFEWAYTRITAHLDRALAVAEARVPARVPAVLKDRGLVLAQVARVAPRPPEVSSAVDGLQRAIDGGGQADWELWWSLGTTHQLSAAPDKWTHAVRAFGRARELVPGGQTSAAIAVLKSLAAAQIQARQLDAAKASFDQAAALAADAERVDVRRQQAEAFAREAERTGSDDAWEMAVEAYRQAVDAAPPAAQVGLLTDLAGTQGKAGQWTAAVETYDRMLPLQTGPDAAFTYQAKARAHVRAAVAAGGDRGQWEQAVRAFQAALDRAPTLTPARLERARALAELGRWADAAADLQRYVRGWAKNYDAQTQLLAAQIEANDAAGSRQTRAGLLAGLPATLTDADANLVAWAVALSPDAPRADVDRGLALVDRALRNTDGYEFLNTRGVLLYRAGKYAEAVEQLQAACANHPGTAGGPPDADPADGSPADQFFLAMAYHRLGKNAEAKAWQAKGVAWLAAADKQRHARPQTLTAWQFVEWEQHRREAERLIGPVK